MPTLARRLTEKDNYEISFDPQFGPMEVGIRQLADPHTLALLLRQAVAETLLKAYRERFLRALPGMVNMRREHFARASARISPTMRQRFLRMSQRFDRAKLSGDAGEVRDAKEALKRISESVRRAVKPGRASRHPLPNSGRGEFRRLAFKVLALVGQENATNTTVTDEGVALGIGPLELLERLRTPSARPTASRRVSLWRHLEFGTGAFATDKSQRLSPHRLASGGWWYGKSPTESLELRGSQPGKFMFDPARRLPYERDFMRFRSVLFTMIQKVLHTDG